MLVAAVAALVWANGWRRRLRGASGHELDLGLDLDLRHWVNDGLMALFFFVVGLEIKRELVVGELRDRRAAALPAIAAVGGVLLPIAIFAALTAGGDGADGWAIPAATDIAFAVGVLSLLGDRVPAGARLFLLTIAIVDDIIAIAIIAVFYAERHLARMAGGRRRGLAVVVLLARIGVARIAVYVPLGVAIWFAVHESGVHATIAGVALGLLTPLVRSAGAACWNCSSTALHPLSAFVVVPLFALANAGVDFGGGVLGDALESRLTWAVVAGLVAGKLLGITGATLLALRLRWGALPPDVRASQRGGNRRARRHRLHGLALHRPARVRGPGARRRGEGRHLRRFDHQRRAGRDAARPRTIGSRQEGLESSCASPCWESRRPGRTPTAPARATSSRAAGRPCCSTAGRASSPSCAASSTTSTSTPW